MSFSGPTAPRTPDDHLRRQIPGDLLRLFLALVIAAIVTLLGVCGLMVTAGPLWLSILFQPCSLLLLPGYLLETLDMNTYSFSGRSVLGISSAFYFCLALLFLFRKHRKRLS